MVKQDCIEMDFLFNRINDFDIVLIDLECTIKDDGLICKTNILKQAKDVLNRLNFDGFCAEMHQEEIKTLNRFIELHNKK